jgi:hypothetical protein
LNDQDSVDPGGGSDKKPPRSRRLILVIAGGAVAVVTTIVLLVALQDDGGGDAHGYPAGSEAGSRAAGPTRVEAPAPKPAPVTPPESQPPPGVGALPAAAGNAAPGHDAGAGSEPPSAARHAATPEPPARGQHTDAGAANASAAPGKRADAGVSAAPDGGVGPRPSDTAARSGGGRTAGGDSGRRAGPRDSRDDDGDFVLVPRFAPTGGAILEGRVLDGEGGRPVAGTVVEARHAGKYMKANTDGSGAFRMVGMPPDTRVVVWIGGRHDPFVPERIDVAIPGEGQVADTGTVRLLRGDEMAPRLEGWVGLFASRKGGHVVVSAVSPWLPADRAGIQVGDALVSVDGRDLGGFGPRAATFLLRGPPGSSTSIVVEDSSKQRRKLTLQRLAR